MNKKYFDTVITVASWEPRFFKGLENWLHMNKCNKIIIFYYSKYEENSLNNRIKLLSILDLKNIQYTEIRLPNSNPAKSWVKISDTVKKEVKSSDKIVLDITTMPRETMWIILDTIKRKKPKVTIKYDRPWRYSKEWLTREPENPRIVYKLGGIAKFNLPTNLLILTGFDMERIDQLISYYEPQKIFIGTHSDTNYSEQRKLFERKIKEYAKLPSVKLFDFHAYSNDFGFTKIEKIIKPLINKSYFIMSSLGPKPGALALYALHKKYKYSGLAYIPCKDYNLNYSYGIRNCISKNLKL